MQRNENRLQCGPEASCERLGLAATSRLVGVWKGPLRAGEPEIPPDNPPEVPPGQPPEVEPGQPDENPSQPPPEVPPGQPPEIPPGTPPEF